MGELLYGCWNWAAVLAKFTAGIGPVPDPRGLLGDICTIPVAGREPVLPVIPLPLRTRGTNWLALLIKSRLTVPGIPTTITVLFKRNFKRALIRVKSLSPVIKTKVEMVGRSNTVSIISINIFKSTVLWTTVLCTIVLLPGLTAGKWAEFPVCWADALEYPKGPVLLCPRGPLGLDWAKEFW